MAKDTRSGPTDVQPDGSRRPLFREGASPDGVVSGMTQRLKESNGSFDPGYKGKAPRSNSKD